MRIENKTLEETLNNKNIGKTINIEYTKDEESWHENIDLIECLSTALTKNDIKHQKHDAFISIQDNIFLQPEFLRFGFIRDDVISTSTKIDVFHQTHMPRGIFEYQHSFALSVEQSIIMGFSSWIELDLVTILDALNGSNELRTLTFNHANTEKNRLITLGATSHYTQNEKDVDEAHSFCPCCLFTNSFDAFKELLNSDDIFGIRLFVKRNEDGTIDADCRVNGFDFDAGKSLLMDYAKKWPERGLEFRKQYVFVTFFNRSDSTYA